MPTPIRQREMTVTEIAEELGVSYQSVQQTIGRALKKLKTAMEQKRIMSTDDVLPDEKEKTE